MKLLIINPNSSQEVTNNLKTILTPPPQVELDFYTGPPQSPREIVVANSQLSADVCLVDIQQKNLNYYDGYLVCCFSNHPLVKSLQLYTQKPVMGIMHASILKTIVSPGNLMIITSTSDWEPVLDEAIYQILGSNDLPTNFKPTTSLNITVLNLQSNFDILSEKMQKLIPHDVNNVILGCAGMSGLDEKLKHIFKINFIDPVAVGVEFLVAHVRSN